MSRDELVGLALRVKAGVEAAYLSLPDRHPTRAILGMVDDGVLRLHDALCDETPPTTNTITVPR